MPEKAVSDPNYLQVAGPLRHMGYFGHGLLQLPGQKTTSVLV